MALEQCEFSRDLVTRSASSWVGLLSHLKGVPNVQYLEIGVFEGRSMIWMFEHILTHPSCQATAIDSFEDKTESVYIENLKRSGLMERVTTLKGASRDRLKELPGKSYDIVYVDGSHKAEDLLSDAVQGWELLKKGGIMVFDDYLFDGDYLQGRTPKMVIDFFVSIYEHELYVLYVDYQYSIKKLV